MDLKLWRSQGHMARTRGISIDLKHQVESGTSWGGQGRVLELWWMAHVPIFLISHRLYEHRQRASGIQYTGMEYAIRWRMPCMGNLEFD